MRYGRAGSIVALALLLGAGGAVAQGNPTQQRQQQQQQIQQQQQQMQRLQAAMQRMDRVQARLHQFNQGLEQQMQRLQQRAQARQQDQARQQAQARDQQQLQRLEQERQRDQARLQQHERLREMAGSMGEIVEHANRNMARVRAMAGDPTAAGDPELRREMEQLSAHWGDVAGELESAIEAMERIRNRLGER